MRKKENLVHTERNDHDRTISIMRSWSQTKVLSLINLMVNLLTRIEHLKTVRAVCTGRIRNIKNPVM